MATLDSTMIHGSLNIKDKITITEDEIDLILPKEDRLQICNEKENLDIYSKNLNINSNGTLDINSSKDFLLHSLQNIRILADKTLDISANRIKLNNTLGTLYGTEDPNDLDLSNIDEGTLYFRVLNN